MSENIGVRKRGSSALIVLAVFLVLGVGGVTGWSSWGHIVHVGLSVGEPSAMVLPVAIDGMMLASTVVGAWDRLHGMRMRFWAIVGLWAGALLTLTFNMISAYTRGIAAMAIAVLYAVTFLVSVEMLFHPSQTPLSAKIKRVKNVVVDEVKSPEPSPVAKTDGDKQGKQKQFPQGQPPRRPDRGQKPWQQRPAKPGNGSGGQAKPTPRPGPTPAKVSVSTPDSTAPLAMGESLKDLVGTDDGKNSQPIEVAVS